MIEGIDISNNNGSVDWNKIARDGKKFAFIKINEGDLIDPTATKARVDAARKAGVLIGGYDFVHPRPGRSGAQEFDIHYKHARAIGLYKSGDLRPVIDIEVTNFPGSTGNAAAKLIARQRTRSYIKSWVKRCVQVTGQHPIIYTGYFWREFLGDWNNDLNCHLWLAAYTPNWKKFIPKAWQKWHTVAIHQYSQSGRVAGIKTLTDLNQSGYRTLADFKRHLTLKPRKQIKNG